MIFCKNCKYCKFDEFATYAGTYVCRNKKAIKCDFYHSWIEYKTCEERNAMNNCNDFIKLSILERICLFRGW